MCQAETLPPSARAVSRASIVAEARTWLGTPYKHLHREKNRFTDCIGLVIGVARVLGLGDYHGKDYSAVPDPEQMGRRLREHLEEIPTGEAKPGDILWFRLLNPSTRELLPRHVGVVGDYSGGGQSVIHAHDLVGRVVEHRIDVKWRRRIHAAFRFKGVTA